MDILYDRSDTIRESYQDVKFTMVLTLGLVVMVIFLFLRNVSATMIPSLALPFSIIGTFAVMYLLNYSLDNLSMMALILSIGFVVDDAIVMLENIVRHMEMGEKPLVASLKGSGEIGFTIVSMTLSLAAVFIPVLFMGGVLGRLFKEFAVTICVAILISGVVSVTLTPMLCSRFLRRPHDEKRGWFYRITEKFFEGMLHVYDAHAASGAALSAGHDGDVSSWCWRPPCTCSSRFPRASFPIRTPTSCRSSPKPRRALRIYQMVEYEKQIADIVSQDPNVESLMASVGGTTASNLGGPNYGELVVHLKPRDQRKLGVNDIIKELRPKLASFAGMQVLPAESADHPDRRTGHQEPLPVLHADARQAELYAQAERDGTKVVEQVPGVEDVTTDVAVATPQVNVTIDRDKAAAMNVNANADRKRALRRLRSALGLDDLRLGQRVQGAAGTGAQYQADPRALSLLYFKNTNGKLIPLDTLAKMRHETGPQTINHYGQLPAATISFNLKPGAALGEVVDEVQEHRRQRLAGHHQHAISRARPRPSRVRSAISGCC